MPHSYSFFKQEVKQWFINNIPPSTKILDVGPGEGTYANLLEGLGYEMHAVEIYEPYVDRFYLRSKYKKVHVNDVMNFLPAFCIYDFIILGDVLEHLTEDDAKILMQDIKDRKMGCLVAVPYMMEQGEWEGNIHETHHQPDLTQDNVLERYPDLELLYANQYYGYYIMKQHKHEKAYVLYCTDSYADTTQACVNSIRKYSTLPIYVYTLGSSREIEGATTISLPHVGDVKQKKYVDRKDPQVYKIMIKRPNIVRDCLKHYALTVAYIDSDSVATQYVDNIFDMYDRRTSHPYFVKGMYDWLSMDGKGLPDKEDDLTNTLEHEACILFNVNQHVRQTYRQTGYFVAGQWCFDFLDEWISMCNHIDVLSHPERYAPFHEETIVNVLLWKRKIFDGLPYVYVNGGVDAVDEIKKIGFKGEENHVREWFKIPATEDKLLFYHGEKDPHAMKEISDTLGEKYVKRTNVLFLAPHLSTGGMPAFLLKRIELLQQYTDVNVYVVEYQNYSADYVVHKNKIEKLCNVFTLLDDKMKLIDIIKNNKIDVVHIDEMIEGFDGHNTVPEELMKALYAEDRTWRIIETCHNVWFNPDKSKRYHPDAYAFCTPHHFVTFKNMPSQKALLEFPIADRRGDYDWQDAFIELEFDGAKEHVVNIGLWTPGKNQKEAVEIARRMPDVQFHFVGNQAVNFQEYWEPIMANLPSNCKVWGERDDAWKFLLAADVFMFNSTWECNPLVVREAVSYGCKILARNLPQYCGMFDGYITPIDENNLKTQLTEALDGYIEYEIPYGKEEQFAIDHAELYLDVCKNEPFKQPVTIIYHNVGQPFLEIKGSSKSMFNVKFHDESGKLHYENNIACNSWVKLNRTYYTKWNVNVRENNELIYESSLDYTGKRVYIAFDSSSLGDTIAWIPYVLEFKKKHNCHVIVSTFKNNLFQDVYPELEFVNPGTAVNNIEGMYVIGWFYDENKEPELPNTIPLQKTATNILGLEYKEIVPRIAFTPKKRPYKKYITIATNSTAGCKFWTRESWQELINHYHNEGYKIVNVSLEDNPFDNCIVPENKSMENTMNLIYYSKFFVGLSSGLSWLAWALKKDVVMISNFTQADHEFKCIRVTNTSVCHGCWNDPQYKFDKGDWNWCPVNKGTDKQFECQTSITSQMVIDRINSEMEEVTLPDSQSS